MAFDFPRKTRIIAGHGRPDVPCLRAQDLWLRLSDQYQSAGRSRTPARTHGRAILVGFAVNYNRRFGIREVAIMADGVSLSLNGKVALITGGSRGIGAATVKMFVAAGAKVLFNYQRSKGAADEVVKSTGGHCVAVRADLNSTRAAAELVTAAVERFGRLDILVANHGIWPPEDVSIDRMTDEQWRKTVATNLDAVFGLIKHSVAQMKQQKSGGKIVLISSTAGQRGEAFH